METASTLEMPVNFYQHLAMKHLRIVNKLYSVLPDYNNTKDSHLHAHHQDSLKSDTVVKSYIILSIYKHIGVQKCHILDHESDKKRFPISLRFHTYNKNGHYCDHYMQCNSNAVSVKQVLNAHFYFSSTYC